jgi:hypothetical protein
VLVIVPVLFRIFSSTLLEVLVCPLEMVIRG